MGGMDPMMMMLLLNDNDSSNSKMLPLMMMMGGMGGAGGMGMNPMMMMLMLDNDCGDYSLKSALKATSKDDASDVNGCDAALTTDVTSASGFTSAASGGAFADDAARIALLKELVKGDKFHDNASQKDMLDSNVKTGSTTTVGATFVTQFLGTAKTNYDACKKKKIYTVAAITDSDAIKTLFKGASDTAIAYPSAVTDSFAAKYKKCLADNGSDDNSLTTLLPLMMMNQQNGGGFMQTQ
jgi:hypothetical protein